MPTISMFFGIVIRMYCSPSEHNPPHIHAYYQDYKAVINIRTCEVVEGNLPKKQSKLVVAWAEILLADWDLASKGELPFRIDPLK